MESKSLNFTGIRCDATGMWHYSFRKNNSEIFYVSGMVVFEPDIKLKGFGEELWCKKFDSEMTLIPGIRRYVTDKDDAVYGYYEYLNTSCMNICWREKIMSVILDWDGLHFFLQTEKVADIILLDESERIRGTELGYEIESVFSVRIKENLHSAWLPMILAAPLLGFLSISAFRRAQSQTISSSFDIKKKIIRIADFHLPGLFEFYDFYKAFLPLFYEHREYFYEWANIASLYGAPADCIWGGGRFGAEDDNAAEVLSLTQEYGISARLTFSNSLLREEHLSDRKCNNLCKMFAESGVESGVIVHSDLLTEYLKKTYPGLYLISSTTKVLTGFKDFSDELKNDSFRYVVPDFRLNRQLNKLNTLSQTEKDKVEFLCNECCYIGCRDRKACYENVSRRILGENCPEFRCTSPVAGEGYVFSEAMKNPSFISREDIKNIYMPNGFSNFKIEGRSLGTAMILEFLLYYMVKPEYQLAVREKIYLDSMLDLF